MGALVETAIGEAFPMLAQQLFGNVRLHFDEAPVDRRRLRSMILGECRISELEAGSHIVFGDKVARASHDPDALKILIQGKGASSIEQGGRLVSFGSGLPVIYDPTRPYRLANHSDVQLVMLQVPRRAFAAETLSSLAVPKQPSREMWGFCQILSATLHSSLAEADNLDAVSRTGLGRTLIDMVRPLIEGGADQDADRPGVLDVLLQRAQTFILDHLDEAGLSVERIAARMGCTPRYIFKAFEREGLTPAQFIWETRLVKTRSALELPGEKTISDIAFAAGFSSSAHFSRAFRDRFGTTPRDYRHAALRRLTS